MNARGSLYQITVHVETFDEQYGYGDLSEVPKDRTLFDTPENRAKWKAERPRALVLRATKPDPAAGHTPEEVLAAYRWAAGVMARVILIVKDDLRREAYRSEHGCINRQQNSFDSRCGRIYEEGVTLPTMTEQGYPVWADVYVPTKQAKAWLAHTQKKLAEVLADDATPPRPKPEEHAGTLPLSNPAPAAEEERTR